MSLKSTASIDGSVGFDCNAVAVVVVVAVDSRVVMNIQAGNFVVGRGDAVSADVDAATWG